MTHWTETYIGKPWASGASGPDAYDCHGVVRAAYRDRLGISLPVVDADALNPFSVARAMRDYDYRPWNPIVSAVLELDVVEMSQHKKPHHVGVYIPDDGGRILTSLEGIGVVSQSRTSLKLNGWNIVACYRWRGAA